MPSSSGRPLPSEHQPYYLKYLDLVPEQDIVAVLENQDHELWEMLRPFSGAASLHRYGPDKWSVREVLGHLVDTERVIGLKLLYAIRQDPTLLVWHDQDLWVQHGHFDQVGVDDLMAEFSDSRASVLHLLRRLGPGDWQQPRLSGAEYTPRALAYLLAGHIRYHARIVKERYQLTSHQV